MFRKKKVVWLLLLPGLAGLMLFYVVPFFGGIYSSLMDGSFENQFVGLANYERTLQNSMFQLGLKNTWELSLLCAPVIWLLAFLLAAMLKTLKDRSTAFRNILLLPYLMPSSAMLLIWTLMFDYGGVINRMGFNNEGVDKVLQNLRSADAFRLRGGILGINIGKNAVTPIENALSDYEKCLDKVYDAADYIAINISSPNTKNLRQLQGAGELEHLVSGIVAKREELKAARNGKHVPIAVKLAPDLENDDILRCVDTLIEKGIDGVICTNTTINRKGVEGLLHAEETGGLSGAPLRERSTAVVRLVAEHVKGEIPIIASGGVMTGSDAVEKMEAGAKLVQLFTGFIYNGPKLVADSVEAIAAWRKKQNS